MSDQRPNEELEIKRPAEALPGPREEAWEFAARAHGGQTRKGSGRPYIVHPNAVARITAEHGGDEAMVAAAFLHDVLEDTETQAAEIHERFGADVGSLVVALSDSRHIADYGERKAALRTQVEAAGSRAILIYVADKLANSTDLRSVFAESGEEGAERHGIPIGLRLEIWRADLAMARPRLGDIPLLAMLEEKLAGVEADRAAAASPGPDR